MMAMLELMASWNEGKKRYELDLRGIKKGTLIKAWIVEPFQHKLIYTGPVDEMEKAMVKYKELGVKPKNFIKIIKSQEIKTIKEREDEINIEFIIGNLDEFSYRIKLDELRSFKIRLKDRIEFLERHDRLSQRVHCSCLKNNCNHSKPIKELLEAKNKGRIEELKSILGEDKQCNQ